MTPDDRDNPTDPTYLPEPADPGDPAGPAGPGELGDRVPYVGQGEDGARRSARIDRDQADGLSWDDPRQQTLDASARRWEAQARRLMLARVGPRPSLVVLRREVGNEAWLAGLALLELSPVLAADALRWAGWDDTAGRYTYPDPTTPDTTPDTDPDPDTAGTADPGGGGARSGGEGVGTFHPDPYLDWEGWVADVDEGGRGWSSTEGRLFQVVAGLTAGRALPLAGVLDQLGSWETPVLDVLVQWASGGNTREYPGRLTITHTDTDTGDTTSDSSDTDGGRG